MKNTAKSTADAVTSIVTKKVALSGKRPPLTLRLFVTGGGNWLELTGEDVVVFGNALDGMDAVNFIRINAIFAPTAGQRWTVLRRGKNKKED